MTRFRNLPIGARFTEVSYIRGKRVRGGLNWTKIDGRSARNGLLGVQIFDWGEEVWPL